MSLALTQGNSVLVFDPNGQYNAFPSTSDPSEAVKRLETDRIVVMAPPAGISVEQSFDALMNELWPVGLMPKYQDLSMLIDETSYLQSPHSLNPSLERLMRLAPEDIRVIQTTHRLVDTNRLTRTLTTDFYLFQNKSGKDLELMRQEFECPELADTVSQLGTYQLAHYTIGVGGERIFWVWQHPEDWYIPINGYGRTKNN